jgi:hypothetical protein
MIADRTKPEMKCQLLRKERAPHPAVVVQWREEGAISVQSLQFFELKKEIPRVKPQGLCSAARDWDNAANLSDTR